jgi:hypothetical protein
MIELTALLVVAVFVQRARRKRQIRRMRSFQPFTDFDVRLIDVLPREHPAIAKSPEGASAAASDFRVN